MRGDACGAILGALLALLATAAAAQETRVRSADVLRSDAPPPVIDGVLDDAIWQGAVTMDSFHQVYPDYGQPASERTEIWLRRDERALYLGARLHDSQPRKINAKQLTRDGNMQEDDRINLIFDTFNNRREGFFFQTNALGTRAEASSEQGPILRPEWDTIWYCASKLDAGGWTVEMAIPFQSLPLDPESDVWGFEVERVLRRRNERARWANWSPNHIISEPGNTGEIHGMRGADGAVLDVKPWFSTSYERSARVETPSFLRRTRDADLRGQPSLDVFYRPRPSVTAALTANPDFSDAPVDLRQNNLTRFEPFYPETRDFFLEDSAIFRFADLSQNGSPFYSRRIGLVDEREVDIDVGLKLTGHLEQLEFGLLQVQTSDEPSRRCRESVGGVVTLDPDCRDPLARGRQGAPQPELDAQSLSVARAKWNLGEESSIGMILTNGDPRDEIENNLIGTDFVYRNSDHPIGRFVANAWFMRTSSTAFELDGPDRSLAGDNNAFGGRLEYPNDAISTYLTFAEFQEEFDPRLGFVNRVATRDRDTGRVAFLNRVGIRDYNYFFRRRTRPVGSWLRTIDHSLQLHFVTDLENHLATQEVTLNLVELASGAEDKFRVSYLINQERPEQDPFIHPDAYIAAGDYAFEQWQVLLESSGARPIKARLELTGGEYYDGRITRTVAALELRPSPHFFFSLEWDQGDARLPEESTPPACVPPYVCPTFFPGDFTRRTLRAKLNLAFTTRVSWTNTIQYDNLTDTTGLNSRFRWELVPGREFFLVLNQGWISNPESFEPITLQTIGKLGWTFRY
jgi:hypothetical protein